MKTPHQADAQISKAIENLQALLDSRLDIQGGYPAQIDIIENKWIVIADVDHDGAPELRILDLSKFLKVWRRAVETDEPLYEVGYPEDCSYEPETCRDHA